MPVLQDHQTALPAQHRPAESRRGILQHQPDLKHEVGARRSARALPAGREYVARVPARRGHAESVGERRPCAGDLRAPAGCGLPAPWPPCRCSRPARRCSHGHSSPRRRRHPASRTRQGWGASCACRASIAVPRRISGPWSPCRPSRRSRSTDSDSTVNARISASASWALNRTT